MLDIHRQSWICFLAGRPVDDPFSTYAKFFEKQTFLLPDRHMYVGKKY